MSLIKSKKQRENYTQEIDKKIVELRNQDISIKEIAKEVGRTVASVTYRINKVLKKYDDFSQIKYQV